MRVPRRREHVREERHTNVQHDERAEPLVRLGDLIVGDFEHRRELRVRAEGLPEVFCLRQRGPDEFREVEERLVGSDLSHSADDLDDRVGRDAIGVVIGKAWKSCEPPNAIEAVRIADKVLAVLRVLEQTLKELHRCINVDRQ